MSDRRKRGCAVCGARSTHEIFRQRFSAIEGATIVDGYDVVTCRECGFAYADGIPDQAEFDAYYGAASKYEYHQRDGQESVFDRRRMEDIAEVVSRLIPSADARILDIGCATGRLLHLLKQRGFPHVTGLDPSLGCAEAAKRLYDVTVLQGSMSTFPNSVGAFDVVILIGVLEHIRDLDAALTQIRAILADGGVVYVEVPNAVDFHRWPNAPFQDFSTEHINFFAPVSLANLFAKHGFEMTFKLEHERDQAFRTTMSCLSAAFRPGDRSPTTLEFDTQSRPGLERYVEGCLAEERRIETVANELADSNKPLFVWGVGTNATHLLTTTRLGRANIQAFVDSNAKYHGKQLVGRPIVAPSSLKNRTEPILVLSRVFQREIVDQIRESLGPDREIITLYDLNPA